MNLDPTQSLVFKCWLNEYCQKKKVNAPKYTTTCFQTKSLPNYACSVQLFNGEVFESIGLFPTKKRAEKNAAQQALIGLGQCTMQSKDDTQTPDTNPYVTDKNISTTSNDNAVNNTLGMTPEPAATTSVGTSGQIVVNPRQTTKRNLFPTLAVSKALLNETAQKLHKDLPIYNSTKASKSKGYLSVVQFNGECYHSNGSFLAKRDAEKSAALEALRAFLNYPENGRDYNAYSNTTTTSLTREQSTSPSVDITSLPNSSGIVESPSGSMETQFITAQENISNPAAVSPNSSNLSVRTVSPVVPVDSSPSNAVDVTHRTVPCIVSPVVATGSFPSNVNDVCNVTPCTVSFKNLLQEYTQQRGVMKSLKYVTNFAGTGFKCIVNFCGKSIACPQECRSKKQAEQMAAREALGILGIVDPENIAGSLKTKVKSRNRSHKRPWLNTHDKQDLVWENPCKRVKLDENYFPPERLTLQSVENNTGFIEYLSVGEIWKEKKNVALIGNVNTSFELFCTRIGHTLTLYNTRTMQDVELKPGYRIIGLDAEFVQKYGRLVLKSERCADVEIPEHPDPVVTSCGAVIIHLDPDDSSNTEVLLKRYNVSQPFINVRAALAQYLRRMFSFNPIALPINSLVEHIGFWKLDEVVHIAAMDVPAMKKVFCNQWKFQGKWCSIFEPPLQQELQEFQVKAQEEAVRRQAHGISSTNENPWGLPKGNFRHRMLTTGLYIEKSHDCAARELREETGIQLDPYDLEKTTFVDIPQDDNLNPHRGDVVRYFLYVYNPIIEEVLNSNLDDSMFYEEPKKQKLDQSTECATNKDELLNISPKIEVSKTNDKMDNVPNQEDSRMMTSWESSEQPTVSMETPDKIIPACTPSKIGVESLSQPTAPESPPSCTSSSSSSSTFVPAEVTKTSPLNTDFEPDVDTSRNEKCPNTESESAMILNIPDRSSVSKHNNIPENNPSDNSCNSPIALSAFPVKSDESGGKISQEQKRGVKRKRSLEDDTSLHYDKGMSDVIPEPGSSTPVSKVTSTRYQSPEVKGGKHEECAWFPIEKALQISPTFATIYKTQAFVDMLSQLNNANT